MEAIAIQRKESDLSLDKIVEMFEVDTQAVKAKRTAVGMQFSRPATAQVAYSGSITFARSGTINSRTIPVTLTSGPT